MESEDAVLALCVGQTLTCFEFQLPQAPEGMEWVPVAGRQGSYQLMYQKKCADSQKKREAPEGVCLCCACNVSACAHVHVSLHTGSAIHLCVLMRM